MADDHPMENYPQIVRKTQALFSAIEDHSSHGEYLDAAGDATAIERMRAALADGADWRALLGPGGRDAAFAAATQGSRGPLEVLLAHGVPTDHSNPGDGMLIHRAAAFSNVDAIRMLVERGVPPDVRDANGRTPLAHAREWNHGQRAVPVLIELMQAHGCTPAPARRGDDLQAKDVRAALPLDASEGLARLVSAFFVERLSGKSDDFLRILAEQYDTLLLADGIALVRKASTAKPKTKVVAGTRNGKPKRVDLVHHGDLEFDGDVDAVTLVVTGTLTVRGLLTNFEGRVIGAGGSLEAHAVWSEGPFSVAGDAKVRDALGMGNNDYLARIGGALDTPVVVHLDRHPFTIGTLRAGQRVDSRADVPDGAFDALKWKKR
jgi:hypothetical protein